MRVIIIFLLVGLNLVGGNPIVSFTENKGQVNDQYSKPRPDVLFSGEVNGLTYHLRNNGISYQITRIDSWTNEIIDKKKPVTEQEPIRIPKTKTVYRLDLTWLDCNKNFKIETEGPLEGFSNYYLEASPSGIHNAQSFRKVIYKDIYKNINVVYYENNGHLKYDYIVAPNSDYKQIKLKVSGAENIKILNDGSLVITTPLGKIEEKAPEVFQNNKKLKSTWVLKNNILSFEINDNINHELPLIIDPAVRLWGTFYGGTGNETSGGTYPSRIARDNSGNIFMTGTTTSATGTVIATSGGFQNTFGGGPGDAFIVKFDASGLRLWSTYYGGSGNDIGSGCSTDNFGNVYLAGTSTSTTSIGSPASHQFTNNGYSDAFLVQFNGNTGARQWGTYYGGLYSDAGSSCATDQLGFVYLTGYAASDIGTSIGTPGSHQPLCGPGNQDGFLVKFSSAGVRQWGTWYGGVGNEDVYGCCTDASGNIYITGLVGPLSGSMSAGTSVATPGTYQTNPSPGNFGEAFLVKFNSGGVRQWGTWYGGSGSDYGYDCDVDQNQNVYMAGITTTSTSVIASPGAHQTVFGGGSYDGMLVKFDQNGQRLWGTFYGGNAYDYGVSCVVDNGGEVYLSGVTASSTGTVIATPGTHQPLIAGTYDGYFVKFASNGQRLWGSYYGGIGSENIYSSDIDANNTLYIYGTSDSSPSGTTVATPGSHQPAWGGGIGMLDVFLAKFSVCEPLNNTPLTNQFICTGNSTTLSASSNTTITWYSSPTSTTSIGSGSVLATSTLSTGTYLYYAESAGCGGRTEIAITVLSYPTISVNSGTVCLGSSFTMTPSGASTYTFSSGSAIVSPTTNTSYSVTGENSAGCVSTNTAIASVTVNTVPGMPGAINGTSVMCSNYGPAGYNVIPVAGATSYTWLLPPGWSGSSTNNNIIATPGTSGNMTVVANNSCGSGSAQTLSITVNPIPTVTANTSATIICGPPFQGTANITASGALTYSWNTTATTTAIVVSPSVTTTYTVTGTDGNGCMNSVIFTQSVSACTAINQIGVSNNEINIYPNPFNEKITIIYSGIKQPFTIYNVLGSVVYKGIIEDQKTEIDLNNLSNGIYFIRISTITKKIIKE